MKIEIIIKNMDILRKTYLEDLSTDSGDLQDHEIMMIEDDIAELEIRSESISDPMIVDSINESIRKIESEINRIKKPLRRNRK